MIAAWGMTSAELHSPSTAICFNDPPPPSVAFYGAVKEERFTLSKSSFVFAFPLSHFLVIKMAVLTSESPKTLVPTCTYAEVYTCIVANFYDWTSIVSPYRFIGEVLTNPHCRQNFTAPNCHCILWLLFIGSKYIKSNCNLKFIFYEVYTHFMFTAIMMDWYGFFLLFLYLKNNISFIRQYKTQHNFNKYCAKQTKPVAQLTGKYAHL